MGAFIDTTGNARLTVGICGRCSLKFPLDDLRPDPNSPGLLVCRDDVDDYDPYRLPPRETEDITVTMPRPDIDIASLPVAPGGPLWTIAESPDDNTPSPQTPPDGNPEFTPD